MMQISRDSFDGILHDPDEGNDGFPLATGNQTASSTALSHRGAGAY